MAEFCRALFILITNEYSEYLSRIVLSDDWLIKSNGVKNRKKVRIFDNDRSIERKPTALKILTFLKWCAISNKSVISLYHFEHDYFTGNTYQTMLINGAFPRFQSLTEDLVFEDMVLFYNITTK